MEVMFVVGKYNDESLCCQLLPDVHSGATEIRQFNNKSKIHHLQSQDKETTSVFSCKV
jgi:hypothetical protein